ncbi:2-phosphosulfolactate phosphatase [Bacillus rhizoplanae]|uniref:Probable 2-phosphosulfolactate phosphatase n=1 Tax=Bacillus rhizoplanae TaxID=2880966 RepID=A0ABM8YEA9_9BACI|nr:2-phosphosulfolactate phosphatase [Bacillus rhizoplanae]CAG9614085.1 2-phosphosulfolactate phosphatase [Bacillus rhizoplanae]
MSVFDQSSFQCRIEWGRRGAREAAKRGDITIIVDVLSFSSTVVTALHVGAEIFPYPLPLNEKAKAYAQQLGAELMLSRAEAAKMGKHSLSPVTFNDVDQGSRFVLCSLNGASCTWIASKVPALFIGCLLNASAVAEAANLLQKQTGANITVVPCGEHWEDPQEDENELRPAIEDYLGAGAIIEKLQGSKSGEAQLCRGAFQYAKSNLNEFIWDCGSGRELRERGFAEDVTHSASLNLLQVVPFLQNDRFVNFIPLSLGSKPPTSRF